jgi:NMT1/THI5 like
MHYMQSRRDFLASASSAAVAGLVGPRSVLADEGPPEVTTIRLSWYPNICLAPGFVSEDLLRAEGFTDVRYLRDTSVDSVARGETDFEFDTAAWVVAHLDAGDPITALSGVHSGCYELFAHEPIRTFGDLKRRKLGIDRRGSGAHLLLVTMAAQVGLDPHKDINWIASPTARFMQLFAEGQVDAFFRVSSRAAGAESARDRSRDPQHGHGQALVAVSLLRCLRPQRLRPRSSGRDQALSPCHPKGRRHVRRRAGAGGATSGRWRVHGAIRLRSPNADRDPLHQMARVRS